MNEVSVTSPSPAIPPSDFADRLSPMLVKELRQGMRSRVFVFSFLCLQGAMIFLAIIGLLLSSSNQNASGVGVFFWIIVGVPLLLILPLNGLNAIGSERKANTLELIFLTPLTARRIVVGKWLAIVAQMGLLVCAVLPYLMLRYFLGSVNLGRELLTLACLTLGSALLSAVTVGFSPLATRIVRTIISIGLIPLLLMSEILLQIGGLTSIGGSPVWDWPTWLANASFALILLTLMLEIGAAKIAPLAENHATPKRLLALAAILAAVLCGHFAIQPTPLYLAAVVIAVAVCAGALCENPVPVRSVYAPFARFGAAGRMCGRLLYPGWQSGALFTLLLWIGWMIFDFSHHPAALMTQQGLMQCVALGGALFFPVALHRGWFPRVRKAGLFFFATQLGVLTLYALSGISDQSIKSDLRPYAECLPLNALIKAMNAEPDELTARIMIAISLLSLLTVLAKSVAPWRKIIALEKQAAAALRAPLPVENAPGIAA